MKRPFDPITRVECMDGAVWEIGQSVRFWSKASKGCAKIIGFRGDRVYLDITPNAIKGQGDYWMLSEQAALNYGKPDFWGARDHGVSLGCLERPSNPWYFGPEGEWADE